jgi:6-phosphofructokinase 2
MRVVTLTLNPSLDTSSSVESMEPDRKLRASAPRHDPGGGGLNVARVVAELGVDAVAVAALGGHFGAVVDDLVRARGLALRAVPIAGATRQNMTVHDRSSGGDYRIIHPGPALSNGEWDTVRTTVLDEVDPATILVLSGSLPAGVPADGFARLAREVVACGGRVVADTSGPALLDVLAAPILLAKPSIDELAEITGRSISGLADAAAAAAGLIGPGRCSALLVSAAAAGAVLVTSDRRPVLLRPPEVTVVTTVGAGDSLVGGLVARLACGDDLLDAAVWGIAAGTATVTEAGTALARRPVVERLRPEVRVLSLT